IPRQDQTFPVPHSPEPRLLERSSAGLQDSRAARSSLDLPEELSNGVLISERRDNKTPLITVDQYETTISQIHSDYEVAELRRQEETHHYLERIDTLQAKLQYLTKEAAEIAKKSANEAQAGSLEEKLARKDEKIALLMEEGQKLSQTELKHANTIRKLCARSTEDERRISLSRRRVEDLERMAQVAQERAKRAEAGEREEAERVKALQRVANEIEKVKSECEAYTSIIADLKQQVAQAKASTEKDYASDYKSLLEKERRLTVELRHEISNAREEKKLSEEIHQVHIRDIVEKADRKGEKAKVAEQELRSELKILESRLEGLRARAEEASSRNAGDTQVKLLRQIETLQTQYSVATENWRGIEASLLSRITGLESERDEIARREADARRKARETSVKARQLEENLQKAFNKTQATERDLIEQNEKLLILQEKLLHAEEDMTNTKMELRAEKDRWLARPVHAENPDVSGQSPKLLHQHSLAVSPILSSQGKCTARKASPDGRLNASTSGLGLTTIPTPFSDHPMGRRHSGQPSQISGFGTPQRHDSFHNNSHQVIHPSVPETPSGGTDQPDDFFGGAMTPATPERTIDDMISVSTVAVGPSVQLVERMSAAVRRLESEKASSRDELERLLAQRDEAREQVVSLIAEADEKRAADTKIKALEAEIAMMNQRYQTTLEMLGEKSELVEELRADVADVKQMYRDLVERTMR
ncbi:MAG: hypothetical protein Q9187_000708, partial [Circinaria calcarea]